MENKTRKALIGILIFILITPNFLLLKVTVKSSAYYSPIPLQNNMYHENGIFFSDTTPIQIAPEQKISLKIQSLLKTDDLTQIVSCFVLLKEQPSHLIADQVWGSPLGSDRAMSRKMIFQETKKKILPLQDELSLAISLLGGVICQKYTLINALLIDIPLQALPELAELPQVTRIEPDYKLKIQLDNSQPTVLNTTSPGWPISLYNGTGVVVAVCDTGIDKTHPNLLGKVINEESFVPLEPDPDDTDGHGTHVAGIIASDNTTYRGVAVNVSLINVKIMDNEGEGDSGTLLNGLEWLFHNNTYTVDVINLSAGATGVADGDTTLARIVDAIVNDYHVVWVNAAGNDGPLSTTIETPGDARNCISVANFNDATWVIVSSSSRGPTDDGRNKPDIAAPGASIWSCNYNWEGAPDDFITKSGTSMAAPHVAGAAALLWQYIELNNSSIASKFYHLIIKGILLHTAYDLGTAGYDYAYGYGAVDMGATWNFLQSGDFSVETMEPSFGICKYGITLATPQVINLTLVWNRDISTDYEYLYINDLSNIDMRIENADGSLLASANSTVENVEQISYNASAGTYYVFVEVTEFNTDPQDYALISSTSLTFIEKIRTWQLWQILLIVSIVGIVIVAAVYTLLWLRDRKKGPVEEEPSEGLSAWPEWTPPQEF